MNTPNPPSRKAIDESIIEAVAAEVYISLNGGQKEFRQAVEAELNRLHNSRKAWRAAREAQEKAETLIRTIRERREETQAQTIAMTEKFHALFEETNGEMTPPLKKVRSEGMLAKDTVIEYDALLARREEEFIIVPWATGHAAHDYIQAHKAVLKKHAHQAFRRFLIKHGPGLFQALALVRLACKNDEAGLPDNGTGVYNGINDAESEFRRFLETAICAPAFSAHPVVGDDEVLKEAGVYPEPEARTDARLRPSPFQVHTHYTLKQEAAKKAEQKKDKK